MRKMSLYASSISYHRTHQRRGWTPPYARAFYELFEGDLPTSSLAPPRDEARRGGEARLREEVKDLRPSIRRRAITRLRTCMYSEAEDR